MLRIPILKGGTFVGESAELQKYGNDSNEKTSRKWRKLWLALNFCSSNNRLSSQGCDGDFHVVTKLRGPFAIRPETLWRRVFYEIFTRGIPREIITMLVYCGICKFLKGLVEMIMAYFNYPRLFQKCSIAKEWLSQLPEVNSQRTRNSVFLCL